MFLRHSTVRKNGKVHTYWRLVRSVRRGRRVTQETVATLGELDAAGRAKARALAEQFGVAPQGPDLFAKSSAPVPVLLDRVRLERSRQFGAVWLGWKLWQMLRLDVLLESLIPRGSEDVPWAQMAAILVLARLHEPSSELHIAETWYRGTALDDVLGVPIDKVNDDRLYRALDQLKPHKEALEKHLRERLGELFRVEYDLLLYDLTSTYFEGEAEANPLARRGHSSDHRPDCKQVCIALVVTREGLPLGYEIFAGNTVGVTTVQDIVGKMEQRFGKADRIWVMDRGMVSEDNLQWLREGERKYLLGSQRGDIKRFRKELTEERDWKKVRDGLEVKLCPGPEGNETFVLCRSEERRAKESAMHDRFSKRIIEGVTSLQRRLESSKKPADRSQVERQIGRLLERNSRAAGKFTIKVDDRSGRLSVTWAENKDWSQWAALTEGAYVLRTNIENWSPQDLWRTYVQLADAEAAFRIHKSDLSLRPVWHQKQSRVEAHILVCFLAYVLWKTLEQWQSRAGLGNSPRAILDELRRIQSADVVLPIADGRNLSLRCVVQPERSLTLMLDRLGIALPKRLQTPGGAQM